MARIYKNGRYYWVDYKGQDGKRHRETTGEEILEKGQYIGSCRANGIVGGLIASNAILWADLVQRWLREHQDNASISADTQRLTYLSLYFDTTNYLHTITPDDIAQIKADLKNKTIGKAQKPIRDATINRYIVLLKRVFNYASKLHYTHQNPTQGLKLLPEYARQRIATQEEYQALKTQAQEILKKAIIIAWETGMRQGEIRSLTNENFIQGDNPYVLLNPEQCKNGESRLIPIAKTSETYGIMLTFQPFTVCDKYFTKGFKRLCRKVGITNLRFHDLRRTFATRLRRSGVDVITAAKLTGHKTLAILQRHYSIVESQDLRDAITRLNTP